MPPPAASSVKYETENDVQTVCRPDRPKLTEEEKNRNHLNSEHKRRTNIRTSMEMLCELVPGLEGKAAAEGEVLEKAIAFIKEQLERNKKLCDQSDAAGLQLPEYARMHAGGSGLPPGGQPPPRPAGPIPEWLVEAVEHMASQADRSRDRMLNPAAAERRGSDSSVSPRVGDGSSPGYEDEADST